MKTHHHHHHQRQQQIIPPIQQSRPVARIRKRILLSLLVSHGITAWMAFYVGSLWKHGGAGSGDADIGWWMTKTQSQQQPPLYSARFSGSLLQDDKMCECKTAIEVEDDKMTNDNAAKIETHGHLQIGRQRQNLDYEDIGIIHSTASRKILSNNLTLMVVDRTSFIETFDVGVPWKDMTDHDNQVLLIYNHKNAKIREPTNEDSERGATKSAAREATEHCSVLHMFLWDTMESTSSTCWALVPQSPPSFHVYKWARTKAAKSKGSSNDNTNVKADNHRQTDNPLVPVSRYYQVHTNDEAATDAKEQPPPKQQQPLIASPPKPISTELALTSLQHYLSIYKTVLKELETLLLTRVTPKFAKSNKPKKWPKSSSSVNNKGTVLCMVTNAGHVELLLNWLCSARALVAQPSQKQEQQEESYEKLRRLLSHVIIFCTDEASYRAVQAMGLTAYYHAELFSPEQTGTTATAGGAAGIVYGSLEYAQMVMSSKVYPLHLLTVLGYDVLFQDVDMAVHKLDYVDYWVDEIVAVDNSNSTRPPYDLYFQYDFEMKSRPNPQYHPWLANSGLYYVRNSVKTKYFFASFLRQADVILRTKSHQAAMTALLSEHASLYGLHVQVLHRNDEDFPVGYHFHNSPDYMKRFLNGKVTPYIFHMNYNENKQTKKAIPRTNWHLVCVEPMYQ